MVFIILWKCLSYSDDWNIHERECMYGTYGSYYVVNKQHPEFNKHRVEMYMDIVIHIIQRANDVIVCHNSILFSRTPFWWVIWSHSKSCYPIHLISILSKVFVWYGYHTTTRLPINLFSMKWFLPTLFEAINVWWFFFSKQNIIPLFRKGILATNYKIDRKETTILPKPILCKTMGSHGSFV